MTFDRNPSGDFASAARPAGRLALLAGVSLVAALLAGCSGAHGIKSASAGPRDGFAADPAADKALAKAEQAVGRAEKAAAKAPDAAASRTALGNAYLAAGRFVSATEAFDDAMTLGDNSPRTVLSLSLAMIGSGQSRDAVALLDDWRGEIPAGDLGLALALAGETSRGVAILADAVRGGDNSAKVRQNLAYAYALDGRWSEAKMMAAQDVPADQLDKRLAYWALSMLPDRNVERVAALIGAPARMQDQGQPAALALKVSPQTQQLAVEVAAPVQAIPAPAAPAFAAEAELAPGAPVSTVASNAAVQAMPVRAAAPVAVRRSVAEAFAMPAVSESRRVRAAVAVAKVRVPQGAVTDRASGGHFVQLGAFSSQQGARRAWGYYAQRNPKLADYRMSITSALVNGKTVWRVAAAGLTGRLAATTLCSRLKSSGGACFAYAVPVQAVPAKAGPMMAVAASGPQRARR